MRKAQDLEHVLYDSMTNAADSLKQLGSLVTKRLSINSARYRGCGCRVTGRRQQPRQVRPS
jgi:hypothetical protein